MTGSRSCNLQFTDSQNIFFLGHCKNRDPQEKNRAREREKISSQNIISNVDDRGEVRIAEDGSADSQNYGSEDFGV